MTTRFSQRHYEAIAAVLRGIALPDRHRETIVRELGIMFEKDNPKFKPALFHKASTPAKES